MSNYIRNFFIGLSNNKLLNKSAKKWGSQLGADKFVAGTDIESVTKTIKALNSKNLSCTVDHLGEFITEKKDATEAKKAIIEMLENIFAEKLDCHLSVKLTQLGLDIDREFCITNMVEILNVANQHQIYINIDMEDYSHYEQTLDVLKKIRKDYQNVGTVMQSYLYRTEDDLNRLKDVRIRIVKGAYKESEEVAFHSKNKIDAHFIKLAKQRLLDSDSAFTSIATHDHMIINEIKDIVKKNNIPLDRFEFQMLYGFRTELQEEIAREGYHFCTYIPYGEDWFGYFMRRLAERPQNINLVVKDAIYQENGKMKKLPLFISLLTASAIIWGILSKRKNN